MRAANELNNSGVDWSATVPVAAFRE